MKNSIKTALVAFVALFANTFVVAQDAQPAKTCDTFKMNLVENVSFYNFDDGQIVQSTTNLDFKLNEKVKVDVALPIYNQSTFINSATGVGDVDVTFTLQDVASWGKVTVDLIGGVGIPLGGDYSSSEAVFTFGGNVGYAWDSFTFTQTVKYDLVDDYTYVPILGGFVSDNIFEAITTLKYDATSDFSVAANAGQYYTNGESTITVGPSVAYKVTNAIDIHGGVDFILNDDLNAEDMDTVVSFGVGFKF
jgi:hypothetical protein